MFRLVYSAYKVSGILFDNDVDWDKFNLITIHLKSFQSVLACLEDQWNDITWLCSDSVLP